MTFISTPCHSNAPEAETMWAMSRLAKPLRLALALAAGISLCACGGGDASKKTDKPVTQQDVKKAPKKKAAAKKKVPAKKKAASKAKK